MLKAIKFYLLDDEDKQTSLEVESAYAIKKNKEKKPNSFQARNAGYLYSAHSGEKYIHLSFR